MGLGADMQRKLIKANTSGSIEHCVLFYVRELLVRLRANCARKNLQTQRVDSLDVAQPVTVRMDGEENPPTTGQTSHGLIPAQ